MVYNIWKETHPEIHERNLKLNTEKIFFSLRLESLQKSDDKLYGKTDTRILLVGV